MSGIFSDKGTPRIILDLLCLNLPVLVGVTGQYNIIEIERNIKKKMPEVLSLYHEYFPKLNLKIISLPSLKKIKDLSGHISDKDIPILASAIKGDVDFLVTGDKKDFERSGKKGKYPFRVVTPSEFLGRILPLILKSISPSHE
jgi:predicted nucleic acid-binding protein